MPSTSDPTASGPAPGSALCTQCGLCCAGALHAAAALDADEVAEARRIGLPVLDREKPGFGLPCPKLEDRRCSIYELRPRVCSRYRCKLLQQLEAGEVQFDDALDRVEAARALFVQASDAMPEGMTLPQARRIGRAPLVAAGAQTNSREHARTLQLRLFTTALDVYLDKYFRNAKDGRAFEDDQSDTGR